MNISLCKGFVWVWLLITLSFFFATATYFQHNDPDPYLWIPVYGIASGLTLLVTFQLTWKLIEGRRRSGWGGWGHGGGVFGIGIEIEIDLNGWKVVEIIGKCHIFYCVLIGVYTIVYWAYRRGDVNGGVVNWTLEEGMMWEEAKEIIGLGITIIWLILLLSFNFIKLGNFGLILGMCLSIGPLIAWALLI